MIDLFQRDYRMIINRLIAKNWRNFQQIDVPLRDRQFIVGPNASGKSNLMDIFRFLRDIVKVDGGGFQKAVKDRGGVSKIRCLAARRNPKVELEVEIAETADSPTTWRYALGFSQEPRGYRRALLTYECVFKENQKILDRPDGSDLRDPDRLTQTFLEQVNMNAEFREIAQFFNNVTYLHLVPQLLRFADTIQGRIVDEDPFGQGFLERIAGVPERTRRSRLKKIESALKIAVPQFEQLEFLRDENTGRPHLRALFSHWRNHGVWQQEDQFSDGTLRLIGLLWALLENDSVLLLEEPELSLNTGIVSELAPLISRMQRNRRCQVLVSTHSDTLLRVQGIDSREVLLLTPLKEGTTVKPVSDIKEIAPLLENGFTIGEVVTSKTHPEETKQLSLLE